MTALHDADRWLDAAACRGMDPDLFHPERGGRETALAAKAVCATCPVTAECLADALRWSGNYDIGVRGGMTALERRRLRTKPRPAGPLLSHAVRCVSIQRRPRAERGVLPL